MFQIKLIKLQAIVFLFNFGDYVVPVKIIKHE